MKKNKVKLGTTRETLLIPLYARYIETRKSEGLITDTASVEIVEKLEYDFSKFDKDKKSALA
ncbi:tetracenomycin C synthesis protein homolog (plasmid) [Calothrix sp. NIES-4071]|nr:tetracenomycin C synthesis protein homolog [Calothrix sp. NIES-4071]BAZ64627.1 tetracenomycin C synthesis protein homolog [Calothrix sp. NIES-4105]